MVNVDQVRSPGVEDNAHAKRNKVQPGVGCKPTADQHELTREPSGRLNRRKKKLEKKNLEKKKEKEVELANREDSAAPDRDQKMLLV